MARSQRENGGGYGMESGQKLYNLGTIICEEFHLHGIII